MKYKKLKKKIKKLANEYGYSFAEIKNLDENAFFYESFKKIDDIEVTMPGCFLRIDHDTYYTDDSYLYVFISYNLASLPKYPFVELGFNYPSKKIYKFIKKMFHKVKLIKDLVDEYQFLKWVLGKSAIEAPDPEMFLELVKIFKYKGYRLPMKEDFFSLMNKLSEI